ncbi:MAG: hypothetical protein AAFY08_09335 [Planctomycetota bacterium]
MLTEPVLTPLNYPHNRRLENRGQDDFLQAFTGNNPGGLNATFSAVVFSFMKFDLSSITAPIDTVTLTLTAFSSISPGTVSIFKVDDDNWAEGPGSSPFGLPSTSLDPNTGITGQNFGDAFLANLNKSTDLLASVDSPGVGEVVFDLSAGEYSDDLSDGFLTLALALDDVPAFRSSAGLFSVYSAESDTPPVLTIIPEPTLGCVVLVGSLIAMSHRPCRSKHR